jgi:hypothetical protein
VRPLYRLLLGLVAAVGLVVGFTGSAWAGTDSPTVCNSGNYSCGKFYNDGDVVTVLDDNCDGHAAVVQVYAPDSGISDSLWNTDGCGIKDTWQYGTGMAEGVTVSIRACRGNWSSQYIYSCSTWVSGTS